MCLAATVSSHAFDEVIKQLGGETHYAFLQGLDQAYLTVRMFCFVTLSLVSEEVGTSIYWKGD